MTTIHLCCWCAKELGIDTGTALIKPSSCQHCRRSGLTLCYEEDPTPPPVSR